MRVKELLKPVNADTVSRVDGDYYSAEDVKVILDNLESKVRHILLVAKKGPNTTEEVVILLDKLQKQLN